MKSTTSIKPVQISLCRSYREWMMMMMTVLAMSRVVMPSNRCWLARVSLDDGTRLIIANEQKESISGINVR
jgi:hypothetical protein